MLRTNYFSKASSWVDLEREYEWKINRSLIILGVLVSFFAGMLILSEPVFLRRIKAIVYDVQVRKLDPVTPSPSILIVDIDEQSLDQMGQWPWPRYRIALLLAKLKKWGATAVALDMVFPEHDRTSPKHFKETIEKDLKVSLSLDGIPDSLQDNDRILADVMKGNPFVLGNFFSFKEYVNDSSCNIPATNIAIVSKGDRKQFNTQLISAKSSICNIEVLAEAAAGAGFYNARPGEDGVFRRVPLLIFYKDKSYPSLALETLLVTQGKKQLLVRQTPNEYIFKLADKDIVLDRLASFYLRFRGPGHTYPYVSAKSVLDDTVERGLFKDKIVIIGSSAVGINDIRSTPVDPVMPGVEVHAVVMDNIIQGDYLQRPYWAPLFEAVAAGFVGLIFYLGMMWAKPFVGLLLLIGISIFLGVGSQYLLAEQGVILSPVPAIMIMIINLSLLSVLKFWREQVLHKKRIRQYQESQEATIGGFSTLAEYRDPETGGHIQRTQHYVKELAEHLASKAKYKDVLNEVVIDVLFKAAPLHDIGKVGVPDDILLKPGRLTDEEFDEMKRHTVYGAEVFKGVEKRIGNTPFIHFALEIANYHQEKWDGSGYPEGLAGEEIPLSARLMALADVYDALISERVYKKAFSHEKSRSIIIEGRGSHFDPDVVDAFLAVENSFREIALNFSDSESQRQALLSDETITESGS